MTAVLLQLCLCKSCARALSAERHRASAGRANCVLAVHNWQAPQASSPRVCAEAGSLSSVYRALTSESSVPLDPLRIGSMPCRVLESPSIHSFILSFAGHYCSAREAIALRWLPGSCLPPREMTPGQSQSQPSVAQHCANSFAAAYRHASCHALLPPHTPHRKQDDTCHSAHVHGRRRGAHPT